MRNATIISLAWSFVFFVSLLSNYSYGEKYYNSQDLERMNFSGEDLIPAYLQESSNFNMEMALLGYHCVTLAEFEKSLIRENALSRLEETRTELTIPDKDELRVLKRIFNEEYIGFDVYGKFHSGIDFDPTSPTCNLNSGILCNFVVPVPLCADFKNGTVPGVLDDILTEYWRNGRYLNDNNFTVKSPDIIEASLSEKTLSDEFLTEVNWLEIKRRLPLLIIGGLGLFIFISGWISRR